MQMDPPSTSPPLAVGSTVRIPDSSGKFRCRAIISDSEGNNVSLIRDDLAPVPLGGVGSFLIAPLFLGVGNSVEECECDNPDDLSELLSFEDESGGETTALEYKKRGDQLLRLNDYTCAAAYYEAALSIIASKSNVSIGGSCIARRNGDAVIADVDCIDGDQFDVTFISRDGEEEEATIPLKDILCSIWVKDDAYLQPRCLLNLSRCLVKLAEFDTTTGNVECHGQTKRATRQEKYRSSAILGCSVTITLCEYLKDSTASPDIELLDSLILKSRLIRSRSFISRNMLRHSMVDAKKVASQNPNDKGALKLISEIKAKEARNKLLDRKISKEVCRWVKKATTTSEGAAAMERMDDESSSVSESDTHLSETDRRSFFVWMLQKTFMWEIGAVFAVIIAMWVIY